MLNKKFMSPALLMLSLGYMIDFFDLTIFAAARPSILNYLQISTEDRVFVSTWMFNAQAIGILLGGVISGMWGDRVGRMSAVRFGIFLYSTSILANIFVTTLPSFLLLRLLSGVGLAGELAASVSLSTELFPEKERSWASGTIYFFGVIGGILATVIGSYFSWKVLFCVGGLAGYALLALRIGFGDSIVFEMTKSNAKIKKGSLKFLLLDKSSIKRILALTMTIVPFWFMAFFVNFAPEVAKGVGMQEKPTISISLACYFIGSLIGSYLFPFLAERYRSRKKSIFFAMLLMVFAVSLFAFGIHFNLAAFYFVLFLIGTSSGYSGIYMSLTAENFGTNQRATSTAFVSCLSRSSLIAINALVPMLVLTLHSTWIASFLLCLFIFTLCSFSLLFIQETHGQSIDFIEKY